MKQEIDSLKEQVLKKIEACTNLKDLNDIRVEYLGKKSPLLEYSDKMPSLSAEDKKVVGTALNMFKKEVTLSLEEMNTILEKKELNSRLETEKIDISLPGVKVKVGSTHPIQKVIEEVEEIFISMGYDVLEGPEMELDLWNFERLNLPKGHPARDTQDSFYITDEVLLRTQTSPMQARTLEANKEKKPFRMICPGKTYRRDNDDATHSHQFHQIEGLIVDENISLADLKGTLEVFAKKLFGDKREIRFRPSFFPFTEPSVEVDISCFKCGGNGCNICKQTGWIEILGAGVVHPNVLKMGGYDPEKYTGFAFGMGPERIAMLKYGINDIRYFYTNDLRFLENFNYYERGDSLEG